MNENKFNFESDVIESDETDISYPGKYNVIMHNDDYTTMEFVVLVLLKIFNHSRKNAEILMQTIHKKGKAVAGTYTLEIAETKVSETMKMAQNEQYPLKCTIEEV